MINKNTTIEEYLKELSSSNATPGGGAASAVSGAQGCALLLMVLNLSIGKKELEEYQSLLNNSKQMFEDNKNNFLELANKDIETFNKMDAIYKMPKTTEEEKNIRKQKMQYTLRECAAVPYEVMELSVQCLKELINIKNYCNKNVVTDFASSATNFENALKCAYLNICVNLNYIKDENFVNEYKNKSLLLYNNGCNLAIEAFEYALSNFTNI